MATFIKELFNTLVDKTQDKPWHDSYEDITRRATERKNRGDDFTVANDGEFLKELIYSWDNGVASIPPYTLGEDKYQILISDSSFMDNINAYIREPNNQNYTNLYKKWQEISQQHGFSFAKAKLNRFAAAFNSSISTTADESRFNQVYSWFDSHGFFANSQPLAEENWYTKNERLIVCLRDGFREELDNGRIDERWINMFIWYIWERLINNPYRLKKQVIKYGPPGTGKTYTAKLDAAREIAIWKAEFEIKDNEYGFDNLCMSIQFHPTFGYEDFIEGLRPTKVYETNPDGTINACKFSYQLKLQNGVFKSFCKEVGKWEIDLYNLGLMPDRSTRDGREAVSPLDKTLSELEQHKDNLLTCGKHWEFIFNILDSNQPKYGCRILRDVLPPYFLIIDEINRAELSRVFGELMYCLEYRGIDGNVATQYALINDEKDSMIMTPQGARFFVPTNLYIIGTMNTIDRSVESFDFALRRRFHWEHVGPNKGIARAYLMSGKCPNTDWADGLLNGWERLNNKIKNEKRFMGEDYQIGHSYLMNLKYGKDNPVSEIRKALWNDSIGPLIEEYLRGTEEDIDTYKKEFGVD